MKRKIGMEYDAEAFAPFREALRELFREMDAAYDKTANGYGFHCNGCDENCCLTRFYHHTWLEYFYIKEGFDALDPDEKEVLFEAARHVVRQYESHEEEGTPIRVMCPFNHDGLCRLYPQRPMICRMHGIAHELRRPGQPPAYGPGCEAFTRQTEGKDYIPFDRTPFYARMAQMEQNLRRELGITEKIRMTVAEMILTF